MKLRILPIYKSWRLLPVILKCAVVAMLIFCANGSAEAAENTSSTVSNQIPSISLGTILSELYIMISEWFRMIVVIMVLAGGIYYIFGRSDDAKAAGISHLKRPIEAVIAVMVIFWFIEWLYSHGAI